jgi:hypothetical protein
VLVDGDEEGRQRKQKIESWAQRTKQECPVIILSDYQEAPCSIEDLLEPNVYNDAVLAACKQAVDAGHLHPQKDDWYTELKRLISSPDGKGGTTRRSLGKRAEHATTEIFGETVSDNNVAIKYSELLQARGETAVGEPSVEEYWGDEALPKLANALWKALKLPTRGDVTGIPLAG